jgi:hypothetical protein
VHRHGQQSFHKQKYTPQSHGQGVPRAQGIQGPQAQNDPTQRGELQQCVNHLRLLCSMCVMRNASACYTQTSLLDEEKDKFTVR